jgi:hypothetical protein
MVYNIKRQDAKQASLFKVEYNIIISTIKQ